MNKNLPCLDLLEATPVILRGLMSEISVEDARWKPAADRFSIAEVLSHLSHSEGHCYRARLDRFLNEQMPEFEPDDAQMYLEVYKNADLNADFEHFEEQRKNNIELLRGLPPATGNRKALHRTAGEITLSNMLHEWSLHDLGLHAPRVQRLRPRRMPMLRQRHLRHGAVHLDRPRVHLRPAARRRHEQSALQTLRRAAT